MEQVNKKDILSNVLEISKAGSMAFVLSLCGAILSGIVNYGFSMIIGLFSQEALQQANLQIFDIEKFKLFFLFGLILFPLSILASSLNLIGGLNAENILKKKIISKVLRQNQSEVAKNHSGDIMTLMTSDVSIIGDYYFQSLNYRFIHPLVGGIAGLVTMVLIDYRFAIASILFGFISIGISLRYTDTTQELQSKSRVLDQESVTLASEMIINEPMIRHYGVQETLLNEYHKKNNSYAHTIYQSDKITERITMYQSIVNVVSMIVFLSLSYYLSVNSDFNFSSVMLLLPLKSVVNYMFSSLGLIWNFLISISVSSQRVLEVLNSKSEEMRENLSNLKEIKQDDIVKFEDVYFSYEDNNILNGINLKIRQGDMIGFVGNSGSGKSTLFKLLLGLYNDYEGSIKIYGNDIQDHSLTSLRDLVVSVEQEAPLFNQSIFTNISLGSRNKVSLEEVISVCKKVGIHDFISTLPEQYDTLVGEAGSKISGGQRQRIAIARALMSHAPILIMDEPTAALDSESERLVQDTINNIKGDKTILISAHRLSTIEKANQILVLNKGVIEESGNHLSLLNNKGLYSEMLIIQRGDNNEG